MEHQLLLAQAGSRENLNNLPELNALVANQLHNIFESQSQQRDTNGAGPNIEDVKMATQRQLAEL